MSDRYRTSSAAEAFDRTISIVGEDSKQALLWHLEHEYDIDATQIKQQDVNKIKYALVGLLGQDGAEILLKQFDLELKRRQ